MLFTHFGISGPLTLSASSHLGDMKKHKYEAFIDLKPALSEEQLYDRITRDFALLANHAAQGALVKLLPSSMQRQAACRCGRLTPRPCRAKRPSASTLQARCWMWTPIPAATICRSHSARHRVLRIIWNDLSVCFADGPLVRATTTTAASGGTASAVTERFKRLEISDS